MGNSTKTAKRVVGKPFEEGKSGNPNGRPKGQRNYATIYRAALLNIAKANDKTPEEIEEMLEVTGLKKALKGDFAFWKDVRDRIHGKPVQPVSGENGEPIAIVFDNAFAPKTKGSSK